ncbi:centriolar coiled-coil protein of 110 kDa-like isoform X2 [Haliotis cracherodii]|uniref:centriolar coiled-coil protein of 110 kDa-like isoform X2 n=1 Tax=Haliotis cracherodii TaxID=6455 RepID=UPI0039ED1736
MIEGDQNQNSPPLLMMGDLIRYFESQRLSLDRYDHMGSTSTNSSDDFVSCIKFNGIPILPPVMTVKRKEEMMTLKRQAKFTEKRIKSRQRSRLMARAQNIVNDTQPTDTSDLDTLSSNFSHSVDDQSMVRDPGYRPHIPPGTLSSHPNTLCSTGQDHTPLQTLTNAAMTFATMDPQHYPGDDPGLMTLDSLSSDLASLEDFSLPTDFSGIPLTSVKQQQISQTLARLSKALNMKESQSLNSTSSSELSEVGQAALKLSLGSPQPSVARFYNPANYSQNNSETSSVFHDSQDTIVEVSQDANSTSGFVSNVNSDVQTDCSGHSPNDSASTANTSHSSANCSVSTVDSQKSNKSSPKSLKNTVHFANFVTEITRQSVEDNITLRKLEETPTNSPRGPSPEKQRTTEPSATTEARESDVHPMSEALHIRQNGSMLSRVEFSPDGESTPSPLGDPSVPFQGYSQDGEVSSSDKENEQRPVSRRGTHHSGSVASTESYTSVRSSDRVESSQGSVRSSGRVDSSQASVSSHSIQPSVTDSYFSYQSDNNLSDSQASSIKQSVSESQASVKSNFTSGTSESESSTLRNDNMTVSKDGSCFSGPLPINSASSDIGHFIRNIIGSDAPRVDVSHGEQEHSSFNQKSEPNEVENKVFKKGHVRKGSYTLSEPSPVLLRSHGLTVQARKTPPNQVMNVPPDAEESASKPLQRQLDYEEVEEEIKPINIPMPPGPEADAKVDHINRYLSHVQRQNLTQGLYPATSAGEPQIGRDGMLNDKVLDSVSIVQSLIESMESMPDADPESILKLHSSRMEMFRQQMISQQRQELEELFVQQRREQLLLQEEVEAHQQRLREQQDFLAENAPENIKKGKMLSQSSEDLDQTEVKVQNVSHHRSHPSLSHNDSMNSLNRSTTKQALFTKREASSPKVYRPVLRSPMKLAPFPRRVGPVVVPDEAFAPHMKPKFDRICAVAKGFLTRRLLQSEKVQELLVTIKDTRDFAFSFSSETPIKRGNFSNQDRDLLERIIAQLQAALLDIHEIFFEIPMAERMSLIAHTRELRDEKRTKASGGSVRASQRRISTATLKAMERKRKAQEAEVSVFGAVPARPRTAPPTTSSPRAHATDLSGPLRRHYHFLFSRALRPLQGQISPIRSEGNSPRNEKERPKTAPEKSDKTRRQSVSKSTVASTSTGKPTKPQPAAKVNVATKTKKKPDKAWR